MKEPADPAAELQASEGTAGLLPACHVTCSRESAAHTPTRVIQSHQPQRVLPFPECHVIGILQFADFSRLAAFT